MRFFVGDDNGQLKSVKCSKSPDSEWKIETSVVDDGGKQGKIKAVQRLAVKLEKIALARSDGTATLFFAEEGAESIRVSQHWDEKRFKTDHRYIGLDITDSGGVISCTSAGHLRLQYPSNDQRNSTSSSSATTSIPNRLCELVVSNDTKSFAYGGDEVEVSVWDTTRAFDPTRQLSSTTIGAKRKKGHSELFDGETWRAKNVSNDFLNLRQPVHNTTLTFMPPVSDRSGPSHHILAGTRIGSVRQYDTRAARKPVADWKDVGKVGGVRRIQRGNSEYEAFVADHGSNLFALDVRTGRVLYAYSGIAGAVSSLAPTSSSISPPILASTSLDRFFRIHSTCTLPKSSQASIEKKGEVLGKHWINSVAGCVAWDGILPKTITRAQEEDGEEDDVWDGMQNVGGGHGLSDSSSEAENENPRAQKSKKLKNR